jgi:hypothetical protein
VVHENGEEEEGLCGQCKLVPVYKGRERGTLWVGARLTPIIASKTIFEDRLWKPTELFVQLSIKWLDIMVGGAKLWLQKWREYGRLQVLLLGIEPYGANVGLCAVQKGYVDTSNTSIAHWTSPQQIDNAPCNYQGAQTMRPKEGKMTLMRTGDLPYSGHGHKSGTLMTSLLLGKSETVL